jgi:hypothetical protein
MKRRLPKVSHARYNPVEDAFVCLVCKKRSQEQRLYDPWEIPQHLKKDHKIYRKDQNISGWNKSFEEVYLRNRKKPLDYPEIEVDKSPDKFDEEEKIRKFKELDTERDSW